MVKPERPFLLQLTSFGFGGTIRDLFVLSLELPSRMDLEDTCSLVDLIVLPLTSKSFSFAFKISVVFDNSLLR